MSGPDFAARALAIAARSAVEDALGLKADLAAPSFTGLVRGDRIALAPSANDTALAVSGFALTGASAQSLLDLAGTWNTSGNPVAMALDITDTASAAGALLARLRINGTSKMELTKGGQLTVPVIALGADAATPDVFLKRDAGNTFGQRNGTNPQTLNIYNTYTDGSNYERGFVGWASNQFQIGVGHAGTGANNRPLVLNADAGGMQFYVQGGGQLKFATGVMYPFSTSTNFDLGLSATAAFRNLYLKGDTVLMSGLPTADPHVTGRLWANAGVVTVSAG